LKPVFIQSSFHIDQEKECGYSYLTSIENCYTEIHFHDFFELLLITDGKLINEVSGASMLLEKGTLVFFRPEDIHQLKQYLDYDCRFINLTIIRRTVKELFCYMGEELETSKLVSSQLPPVLTLTEGQTMEIEDIFNRLIILPGTDKKLIRSSLRMLLVDVYFKYLPMVWQDNDPLIPYWLSRLCDDMKKKEVFQNGITELIRLTNKNHAYLCRVFKKYLNTTPTNHLNKIRLNYAENLLLNSDLSILDICLETGFNSLSHFYKLFDIRYGMTPYKYRRKYWKSSHKWS